MLIDDSGRRLSPLEVANLRAFGEPPRFVVRRTAHHWIVVDTATGIVVAKFDFTQRDLAYLDADARNDEAS